MRVLCIALMFIAVVLAAATPVSADQMFSATLIPTPISGSGGSGSATLVLNAAETQVSYTITFSGLTSSELAAHIHNPDGSVAHPLPLGSPKNGVWSGLGLLDVLNLKAGQLFILIHTEQNPGGELRGNISQSVPVEDTTWGAIKSLFR